MDFFHTVPSNVPTVSSSVVMASHVSHPGSSKRPEIEQHSTHFWAEEMDQGKKVLTPKPASLRPGTPMVSKLPFDLHQVSARCMNMHTHVHTYIHINMYIHFFSNWICAATRNRGHKHRQSRCSTTQHTPGIQETKMHAWAHTGTARAHTGPGTHACTRKCMT